MKGNSSHVEQKNEGAHVDRPLVDITHFAYAKSCELGPRDFAKRFPSPS